MASFKYTIKILLKSGVTLKIRCDDFTAKSDNQKLISYDYQGMDGLNDRLMFLSLNEVAAITMDVNWVTATKVRIREFFSSALSFTK